jgi:beta-phosphoglucomutase
MNIIIPLGGKGERFKSQFNVPKPFIPIFEKDMLCYVLDNLHLKSEDKLFIIYYNLDEQHLKNITSRYSAHLIPIHKQTEGAVETLLLGIQSIKPQTSLKKCVLMDCDTFYTQDILGLYRNQPNNAVFYTHNSNPNPIFSYIQMNSDSEITEIQEKIKISDYANTGIYCFRDIQELESYANHVLQTNFRFKGEFYTSCVIHQMIEKGSIFIGIYLSSDRIFNLGTPNQLEDYVRQTLLFLFDLDGTLIQSDDIYFNVLEHILSEHRIQLTRDIFDQYIQGQNDKNALQRLFPSCYEQFLPQISNLKDELFCQHIQKIKIIPGAIDFLRQIKERGHKIAIVTNCNRKVAEAILEYIQINQWVDILVIGNECPCTKPDPEPYLQAIRYFQSDASKSIIFEDSKAGLQSAVRTLPRIVIGLETNYSADELLQMGANQTLKNYHIDLDRVCLPVLNIYTVDPHSLTDWIRLSLKHIKPMHVKNIHFSNEKLKGGFISDVIAIQIETPENIFDCALKLENKTPSFLSRMANELGLYEREYYFYENLSKFVPVQIPSFYGLIYDSQFQKIGILMQNLNHSEYHLNLNLNQVSVDVSLCVIDRLAQLHAKFWDKPLSNTFKELKRNCEFDSWPNFVQERWKPFEQNWKKYLTPQQLEYGLKIVNEFCDIQKDLSIGPLTLCHGDVKSANIFYKTDSSVQGGYEPYFIDWQYILHGKGVQDLVFFMIESFEPECIKQYKQLFKDYYYTKLVEYGVQGYTKVQYEYDFVRASQCFPFFVAMWFGSLDKDELVDVNFPFFYVQRLFYFYSV